MSIVLGIDPGIHGAFVAYDTTTGKIVYCEDMPTWEMTVGNTRRQRVDAVAVDEMFTFFREMLGVKMVIMEAVGGRPRQSASAGFVFGYVVGLLYFACVTHKLPVETIPPATWKKKYGVQGKKNKGNAAVQSAKDIKDGIIKRADDLFPEHRDMWRGKKGGYRVDRAEAAMLARFGGDFILPERDRIPKITDQEWRLAYRNADTGGA